MYVIKFQTFEYFEYYAEKVQFNKFEIHLRSDGATYLLFTDQIMSEMEYKLSSSFHMNETGTLIYLYDYKTNYTM